VATSVVPALIDALVTRTTAALPDIRVYDGYGISDDPGDYLMIGVEDPDLEGAAFSADVRQDWATTGIDGSREEVGEITCFALSWNGNANQKAARDSAYATVAAVETTLRTTPALGLTNVLWTSFGTSLQFSQAQGQAGAAAMVIFRINFQARI